MPTFADYLPAALVTVVVLGGVDWVLGILAAVKAHTFDIHKLPDQLENTFLPYLVPLLVAAVASPSDWRGAIVAPAAAAAAKLGVDIAEKVHVLTIP